MYGLSGASSVDSSRRDSALSSMPRKTRSVWRRLRARWANARESRSLTTARASALGSGAGGATVPDGDPAEAGSAWAVAAVAAPSAVAEAAAPRRRQVAKEAEPADRRCGPAMKRGHRRPCAAVGKLRDGPLWFSLIKVLSQWWRIRARGGP
jgi:hypothetical protein